MDTNLEETSKTSEQDASTIVATDRKTVAIETTTIEELEIYDDVLVTKIKELIAQGNVRRIIIRNETSHTLIEISLTVGVIGTVIRAAVGVIGAMVAHLTVVIERQESG
jgi:Domain of unknown function (DUF4342)